MNQNNLSNELKHPSLLKMTWPIFIELLMGVLTGNIDQLMVSRISQDSVVAIGNANQVLNLLILTFGIISLSTTILISQYIGANQREKLGEIYTLAIVVNIVVGGIISAVLVIFAHPIAVAMGIDPVIYSDFERYLSIVGGCVFLTAIFNTFTAIFKSNAMMTEIMCLSIGINIVNIIVNWILINGIGPLPQMGLTGAALATVLSRLIAVIIIICMYYKKIKNSLSIKQLFPFPKKMFGKMLTIGIPSGGESISYSITCIVIMVWINGFGINAASARFYAGMFSCFTWMFASAISMASQILVGYHMGAGDQNGAEKQVFKTLKLALASSAIIAIGLWLLSGWLFSWVTSSNNDSSIVPAEVIRLGQTVLMIDIFLECGRAVNMTMVRSLQAAGDTKFPILLGICSTWLFAVGLSYVLGVRCGMGLPGVYIAMATDELTRAVIFIFRWKSGVWRTKNLIA
jgi:putative MATE family efflux protein